MPDGVDAVIDKDYKGDYTPKLPNLQVIAVSSDFEDEDLGQSPSAETPADACHIGDPDCESCQ